jgi:hypothetical protein
VRVDGHLLAVLEQAHHDLDANNLALLVQDGCRQLVEL